ncbi:phenylalanine--tRNA ligase subunit alpha [Candidatus Woesebacteria bacterium]|nr:phenylalanine--tRNA ligase subunit alpha [Candidatus Woesebacteria bacterium]
MREEIISIKNEAMAQIMDADSSAELEELRISYLGRSGKLTSLIKRLKEIPSDERKEVGVLINDSKSAIESLLAEQKNRIGEVTRKWFDPTIPGIAPKRGHLHLITKAIKEISRTFEQIGFVRVRYPEVEWDFFAFEGLNMPKGDMSPHPKYGQIVLTPHTSSGQIREMKRVKTPPIRMINIAKCYRRQIDASHVPMFHQFEGLVIDKGISIAHLKGTLDYFARNFFGPQRKTRLRPFHFQFTEPSFEVDITCGICLGKGCKVCKRGWLELGGAGMVHPTVLTNGGIDPKVYSGFAFGWGVERTYMMKSGLSIPDIRLLYSSDLKFLRQF